MSVAEDVARQRALQVELREVAGDVADDHRAVAGRPREQPGDVAVGGVGGDHQEPVVGQLRHGQVGLDPAVVVEPLGVGDPPRLAVHVAGRQLVEHRARVGAGHRELRHERHVHQPDALAHRAVLVGPLLEPRRVAPGRLGDRVAPGPGEPVGALPAGHLAQQPAVADQPLVHRREQPVARRAQLLARRVGGVHGAEDLGRPVAAVRRLELVGAEAGDVPRGDVDVGQPGDDPVREHAAEPAGGQHADGVHAGGDEVVADARRLADGRHQVGRERLGAAEERPHPDLEGDRHPGHRGLEERRHPVPVGLQRGERRGRRDAVDGPRGGARLEEADHHPAALLAVVAVGGGVLEDRPVRVDALDGVGDQVVVLGRLVGYDDAALLGELAGPHAGAVHDVLALDVAVSPVAPARADPDPGHGAVAGQYVVDPDALDDPDAEVLRAAGQRLGEVDRVDPAVAGHVEAGEQVVGLRPREEVGHLPRRDLVDLEPEVALERRDPAVLVQPVGVGRRLDQPDRLEPGGHPGLGLEPGVEVAGVQPDAGAGLGGRAEAGHQPGRVPRRTAGEPVALDDHDVGPAFVGEVVGNRAPDHAATDDDDTGPVRQRGESHRHNLASRTSYVASPRWLRPYDVRRTARPYAVGKQVRVGVPADLPWTAYDERT